MSWKLIKSIQKEAADLRLILPFGLNLQPGDVVTVGKDGGFTLEGNSASLLGMKVGPTRDPSAAAVALTLQGGKDTRREFRAAGQGSTLFQELPKANAGFDISFGSSEGWLLAFTGRIIYALPEVNKFRTSILNAYNRKVWKADWVLITSVSTVEAMTLLAARSSDTKIALKLAGEVQDTTAMEVKLTAGVQIMATSKEITQCVVSQRMPAFCAGIRVQDHWWTTPGFGTLDFVEKPKEDIETANNFWEEMDKGIPGSGD